MPRPGFSAPTEASFVRFLASLRSPRSRKADPFLGFARANRSYPDDPAPLVRSMPRFFPSFISVSLRRFGVCRAVLEGKRHFEMCVYRCRAGRQRLFDVLMTARTDPRGAYPFEWSHCRAVGSPIHPCRFSKPRRAIPVLIRTYAILRGPRVVVGCRRDA